MIAVTPLSGALRLLPVAVLLLVTRQGDAVGRLWVPLGIALVLVIAGVVRWRTTQYRITADRVELHTGWLRRQRRSVPRDRIRTVDLTSRLVHRVFGLSVVQVGAASGSSGDSAGLALDAVSKTEADRLRRELLDRSAAITPERPAPAPVDELARLRWSWLRFAPLTFSAIAGSGAVFAAAFNLFDDLGVDPRDVPGVDDAAHRLTAAPIWLGVLVVSGVLVVVAVIGSLLLFAERWYAYRLTREATAEGGALRVRRGLLTRRSLSVSERRLRGAEVVEPILLRAGRGAQTRALATGLSRDAQGGALQPPAPRAEAHRVAAVALREHPGLATRAPLRRHPRAALRRRLTRALHRPDPVARAGEPRAAAGRRGTRPRPLPQPRPSAHRPPPGDAPGLGAAADGRPATGRGDRLDLPAERVPAPRRTGRGRGRHGGGRGRLPGARRRRRRRRGARRRHDPGPAGPVQGAVRALNRVLARARDSARPATSARSRCVSAACACRRGLS
jgi:putative membrane protein